MVSNLKGMKSKDYHDLLLNEYDNKELSREDLSSTLEHYAELYHKEQKENLEMAEYLKLKSKYEGS